MATAIEIKEELKALGIETEEKNVPKLNKMLKEAKAAATPATVAAEKAKVVEALGAFPDVVLTGEESLEEVRALLEKAEADKKEPGEGDGGDEGTELSHVVTAEDLERRPEMIEQGINEGDEVSFDTQEEYDEFLAPPAPAKKRVQLSTRSVSSEKGFDIIRNGTYYLRTYPTETGAIDFLKKHELQNQSLPAEQRMYFTIVPANETLEVEVVYRRTKITNNLAATVTERIKFSEEENGPKWKSLAIDHAHQWPDSHIVVTVKADKK